ncbi:MAG: T9SS type A sorting domain-containing protein [Flavobacteriales bacterium]|nr:T9SS type A sorting domain-containing protein [Flavobacteriales bacterium]
MKKLILLAALVATVINASAQTSIANGNWTSPFTWNCTCVPMPGATVTIAHAVVLNTDWITNSGSIIINSGASLIQDATGHDIQIAGGFITNNGTFNLRYIYNQTGTMNNNGNMSVSSFLNMSAFQNTGTVTGVDSIYTNGTLTNSGSLEVFAFQNVNQLNNSGMIINVDSMSNSGTLVNSVGAEIHADSATNSGTFTNNGSCFHVAMTNSGTFTNNNYIALNDFTNWGTFNNHDSIVATGSMTNGGDFINHATAVLDFDVSFLNDNFITHNASFENNGYLEVGDSWYNFDLFLGNATGMVDVQDTSANVGTMTGNFDLCDHSPNTIVPSQSQGTGLDYNAGTVDNTITWCMITQIAEQETSSLMIYPNPTDRFIYIDGVSENGVLRLFDLQGKLLMQYGSQVEINVEHLQSGIYLLQIEDNATFTRQRIAVTH